MLKRNSVVKFKEMLIERLPCTRTRFTRSVQGSREPNAKRLFWFTAVLQSVLL